MKKAKIGELLEGTVVKVYSRYAILLFEGGETGLLHISELSSSFVHNFTGFVQVGNIYKVKVIAHDTERGSIKVSLRQVSGPERRKSLSKQKIDPSEISFEGLKNKLPLWIKTAKEGMEKKA